MRKIFHVAVNAVQFKKSQRKWDFLLRLSVSLWIFLFACHGEGICLSNCLNSCGYSSRGGILTTRRVDFHKPSLKFPGLLTSNRAHSIPAEHCSPLRGQNKCQTANLNQDQCHQKFHILPRTEAPCNNKQLNVLTGL